MSQKPDPNCLIYPGAKEAGTTYCTDYFITGLLQHTYSFLHTTYEESRETITLHLLISLSQCVKFMMTYILQYEIPLRIKFSNSGHDLLSRL